MLGLAQQIRSRIFLTLMPLKQVTKICLNNFNPSLTMLKTSQMKANNESYFGEFEITELENECIHLTVYTSIKSN